MFRPSDPLPHRQAIAAHHVIEVQGDELTRLDHDHVGDGALAPAERAMASVVCQTATRPSRVRSLRRAIDTAPQGRYLKKPESASPSPLNMHTSSVRAQSIPRFLPVPEGSMSRGAWFAMTLLSLCAASVVRAQSRVISGKVVNATTRDAVPFATVSVVDRKSTRLNSSH